MDLPEQGQLVEVRRRRYVVTDVAPSTLPVSPLSNEGRPHTLISLASVEDDALGEELQVIWELEPGAQIYDSLALPSPLGFDPPRRLDAFLNAVRWGAASSANVRALQSPFRSGIDVEEYQLDPVVRAIQMPRVNLLIADDVGLGKTIEAGLVAQELIIRHRARRILVVCPAALQIQWRDQMRDKFGLEFHIVDSELFKTLRRQRGIHANPWSHFPRLITSIDFLKRDRPLRLLRELLPAEGEVAYPRRFDLLIVDEAHNVAPPGRGQYAIDSQRTATIRLLTPHFEHKLFLTATPHNGYAESFSALLELLDNQRFARGIPPDRESLSAVMVRRMKTEIQNWNGTPRFPARCLSAIEVDYTEEERQAHRELQRYTELRQRAINESTPAQRTAVEFVLKLLKKRLFSSPAAFALTLAQHQATLNQSRVEPESTKAHPPSEGILRAMLEKVEEEFADDEEYTEETENAVHTTTRMFLPLTEEEKKVLTALQSWADRAAARRDSKADELIAWLEKTLRPQGKWTDERVIIFTEYRDTQKWIHGLLAAAGLAANGRLLTLYGGMPTADREKIKAAFQAAPEVSEVRILLATDAASEGIDLQRHCHQLIHYEIPWNPNRMEQRNGRIDRHGQKQPPQIFHFAPRGYQTHSAGEIPVGELEGDLEFLMRAVQKVEQIREDLGKVGPVIADQVTQAMLGKRRRLETQTAESGNEPVRRMLKFEHQLQKRIEELHNQLQESQRELNLSPINIQEAVEIGLELAGQPPLIPIKLPEHEDRPAGTAFALPPLHGSWESCAEGLAHPHTGAIRPLVFDPDLARGRDDVVLAHLNHRLVQLALRLLRAEVWTHHEIPALYRVTARLAPDHALREPVVVAHARLVVIGGGRHRLHEELIVAGGEIVQGRFRRLNLTQIENALNAAQTESPPPKICAGFTRLWPALNPGLEQALESRMKERAAGLEKQLADRQSKEKADIETILTELENAIREELQEPEGPYQLELFSLAEKEQFQRNKIALETRLKQIPTEKEQEAALIQARYADPQPRLFPVAVTFIIPQKRTRE